MEAKILDFKKERITKIIIGLFIFFAVWRIIIGLNSSVSDTTSFIWGASYQLIAIVGAIWGFYASKSWGGWKSITGRMILAFSLGLLFQVIGQSISSYYVFTIKEIPYPSLGDIGFFGSIPFYLYGVFMLGKASGVTTSLKRGSELKKIATLGFFGLIILISYFVFLKGYDFNGAQVLTVFLDFGYPLLQATYIAATFLILLVSKDSLGGIMKKPIIVLLVALIWQYISDTTFLFQSSKGLYIPEGVNDLMYLISYFVMAIGLIYMKHVFNRLFESK